MNCDERGDLITIGASALGEAVMRLVASLGACIGLRYGVSADAEYVVEQIVERDEEGVRAVESVCRNEEGCR